MMTGSFRCPKCDREYGDPLFHGPAGHAPRQLCFDCWASEWGIMEAVISNGGDWRPLDTALFLLCQGFSQAEAAEAMGLCRRTIAFWILSLRQHPELTPQWLIDRCETRRQLAG